jgi:hypothetical protein
MAHGIAFWDLDVEDSLELGCWNLVLSLRGHWVLKPQNSQLWYKTVNEWVDQWCAK